MGNINLKKILAYSVRFNSNLDSENLRELLYLSKIYKTASLSRLKNYAEDVETDVSLDEDQKHDLLEQLGSDADNVNDIASIGEELAIIGLYKTIEVQIKKCSTPSGLFTQEIIKTFSIFKKLKSSFLDIGIDITKITNFKEFNELRAINNCLKHSGQIDQELLDINPSFGRLKSDVTNLSDHFHRLLDPSLNFLKLLGDEIVKKMETS